MAANETTVVDTACQVMAEAAARVKSDAVTIDNLRTEVARLRSENEMLKRDLCAALGAEDLQ